MSLEQDLKKGEAIAKAATAALGAYAPLALMGIEGIKWLRARLKKNGGTLTESDIADYEADMAAWQANIDAAQAHVDEFKRLRAEELARPDNTLPPAPDQGLPSTPARPDNTLPATPTPKTPNSLSTD